MNVRNITVLNNPPVISNQLHNGTGQIYRAQKLWVNLTGTDIEDASDILTSYLCINRSDNSWFNTSIPFQSVSFFELNFTIPNDDVYLGLTKLYIVLNDSDLGLDFVSLVNITIINNLPIISNQANVKTTEIVKTFKKSKFLKTKEITELEIALDTEVTEDLKVERMVRELQRNIQQTRKKNKFHVQDFIDIAIVCSNEKTLASLEKHGENLQQKISAKTMELFTELPAKAKKWKIKGSLTFDKDKLEFSFKKA